jgi:hypothetical protein
MNIMMFLQFFEIYNNLKRYNHRGDDTAVATKDLK